jgi:hypothetical protein
MEEDYSSFSKNIFNSEINEKEIEKFPDHYNIKNEFYQNVNYCLDEDLKTELINMIFEMDKSIQIFIESSTRDSSNNFSEIMEYLNESTKKKCIINNKFNKKDLCNDKIFKPRPLSNNISKGLFNCKKNCKILIAKRVPLKSSL